MKLISYICYCLCAGMSVFCFLTLEDKSHANFFAIWSVANYLIYKEAN